MNKPHLIVIGNGMAGCRAVEEILARDADRYRITIFGAELHVNYKPDVTMPELAVRLKVETKVVAHPASLSRVLVRAGYRYKKSPDGIGMRS